MLRLIVGLGNPGQQYQKTRHNAGFWFLDQLLVEIGVTWRQESRFQCLFAKSEIAGEQVYFVKPQGFMNRSGEAVGMVARYYKIATDAILVVHDELDFEAGIVRLKRAGGGHGGHNGLRNIVANLGSKDFVRLRIGIGHPGNSNQVANYVLSAPSKIDRDKIGAVVTEAINYVDLLYSCGFEKFMSQLH